jgi:prevent-host-death family protein
MVPVNVKEMRKRLSAIVTAVEQGESVVVTRRGKRVARLVPFREPRLRRLPDLTAFRASFQVKGKPLSEVVAEGRRKARY